MKLTAQDLQIGNYFYRPDCADKVVEIRKNGVIGLDLLRGLIPFSEIKGIPITPKILEKNGFEKLEEKYYRRFLEEKGYYESVRVYFDEEPNVAVRVLDGSEFKGRIKYIHELQQAMRLCKIRKEIEL